MLDKYISKVTDDDRDLFESYIHPSKPRFENSFDFIKIYFDNGRNVAYKYCNDENLIFFSKMGKNRIRHQISKPLGEDVIDKSLSLHSHLKTVSDGDLFIRDLDEDLVRELDCEKIRRFEQFIYDLKEINDLKGSRWRNVRQKINRFQKDHKEVRIRKLNKDNYKDAVHLIGAWRKHGLEERGFSYSDIKKNLFTARYYSDKIDDENIWSYIYYIKSRPVSFQFLYRVSDDSAAHSIGISNIDFEGLSEFSQIDTWLMVKDCGIRLINDGYTWSNKLRTYKKKFNPMGKEIVYWCIPRIGE